MEFRQFVKKEPILMASILLALISLFFVPIERVLTYRYSSIMVTICILFCFLIIVAGLNECNALKLVAEKALNGKKSSRSLCLALVLFTFLFATLFSNDVALVTFVPLSIIVLKMACMEKMVLPVVVLQTAAANIGSSLTPFGNPHNLYVFSLRNQYGFTIWEYEAALIPIVIAGAIVIAVLTLLIRDEKMEVCLKDKVELEHRNRLPVIVILLLLSIAGVMGFIDCFIVTMVVAVAFLLMMPRAFKKVNYSILFTFFFLFVFANGVTNAEGISDALRGMMGWDPMITTVGVSQIASNVPSTILLEQFTDNWSALVVGADIGGFGTPIASMASVISLGIYSKESGSDVKRYILVYSLMCILMLLVLIPVYYIFCR